MKHFTPIGMLMMAAMLAGCGGGSAGSDGSNGGGATRSPPAVVADLTCTLDSSNWDDSTWAE
jgi:hypothetical protein